MGELGLEGMREPELDCAEGKSASLGETAEEGGGTGEGGSL